MAEWLFEILSEEIPSSMQPGAQAQFKVLAEKYLQEKKLSFKSVKTFVTPRRLTLVVDGLPLSTEDEIEERKGPRKDSPQEAIEGFLKATGVCLEECLVKETPKGSFLYVVQKTPGRATQESLSQISLSILESFRWPKSMRWEDLSTSWIRPLRGLLNLFDGAVVSLSYAGLSASQDAEPYQKDFQDFGEKAVFLRKD